MSRIFAPIVLVLAGLGGCAGGPTKAILTYETVPPGAELFEGGKSLGIAPVTRTYPGDGKSGEIQTPDVKAVWPSGATTTFFTVLPVGADRVATLERPASAPGMQQDVEHGKTVAAARKADEERLKQEQRRDAALNSARCRAQQANGNLALSDDCSAH